MKNGTKWNTELAMELESLFYKDSVPEEWIEIVDKLDRRWQGIADLIGFDFTDEDVIKKIENFFPVTDEKSSLYFFDNAAEAIDFFQDMRIIKARRAWFFIRTTKESYSPAVQALIEICREIIDWGSVALRQKSYRVFENIIFCVSGAIENNDVTYNSLCLLCTVIQDLDKFQIDWATRFSENVRGSKIAQGKQKKVEIRKAYFAEFEKYFANRCQKGKMISKHHAASDFFKQKKNDENFNKIWKSPNSFYRAYTDRKQPTKNKARLEEQQKKNSVLDIPTEMADVLNKWLNDEKATE